MNSAKKLTILVFAVYTLLAYQPQTNALAPLSVTAENMVHKQEQNQTTAIVRLLFKDLQDADTLKNFNAQIKRNIDIRNSDLLSSETKEQLKAYLGTPETKNYQQAKTALLNEFDIVYSKFINADSLGDIFHAECAYRPSTNPIMLAMNDERLQKKDNIGPDPYQIYEDNPLLQQLSNEKYMNYGDVLWRMRQTLSGGDLIEFSYDPNAEYDIGIKPSAKQDSQGRRIHLIYIRDLQDLEYLLMNSEYIFALITTTIFPEQNLKSAYNFRKTKALAPFDPFIRLFHDQVFRLKNNIPLLASYTEYTQMLRENEEKNYYTQNEDPKGYFRQFDLPQEINTQTIRLRYLHFKRRHSVSMISPFVESNEQDERQRREETLKKLKEAYETLAFPLNRILYDLVFRKENPELLVEAAA